MRKSLAVALSSLFVLGAIASGWAQPPPAGGQPEKPAAEKVAPSKAAPKAQRLTGSIKSASEESLVLEVRQKDKSTKEYAFALDPKAKLSKAGKAITAKELQPGDPATVSFTEAEGKLVAKAVTVRVSGAK